MKKLTVALLSGGISSEREISIKSGDQVYEALDKEKYTIFRYDPKTDLVRLVSDAPQIDVALIILHGPYGEDGTIQGFLDLLNIPYQGSGVLGSAVAMDKVISKQLYEKSGLPVPVYSAVKRSDVFDPEDLAEQIGLPLVVKPVNAGSSVGITIVESITDIKDAVESAFDHDDMILIEAFIPGIELTAGVIGNEVLNALPIIEIIPDKANAFFDYEAKYTAGVTQEICPARIDDALTEKAKTYAKIAHHALSCRGYSRTDMIFNNEELYVLETNTIPGMTATSLFPQAAEVAGISFPTVLDKLIELGIEEGKLKKR
ncbi:MAG: D-alanine--D-alanine ligase [Desulfobacterales bacterium]|jgi:D-alanine-D-alanine ligase|nr:D-alanine--D-alanine ligase [Desulfobacter sp.]MDP6395006.1 D-alanine--D-alanine ligase [Desulfobacterales bacterium]MDP6683061.1 D-alanine--D-alanine ligase [Desulfobacterales bacterium]MDP6806518.1 D-alanine--D-alanine ligase [Desulfobacterales bacterium]|tara:strand:- start:166939 stop:167886 length:948 start_codon:yes stop_codon:yes gene_type:complete